MEDLKASLIRQTEQAIDVLRKDEERLKTQLAEIEPKLVEARAMLELIKTGQISTSKPKRTITKHEDALEALNLFDKDFTSIDYAEVLGVTSAAAAQWLKKFYKEGLVVKMQESVIAPGGRKPAVFRRK